ncbi:UPF0587 protein C2D10.03c [Erysiphe neolycopersici]|uniref:UPF0587 protein C2D10.03c n=1 Tax=Erysiphe neolycopersici TaxID=212602 RepID=A0A420HDU8_9PEZI|nr:UPF0587 protein C2D10.03c [Erysiphe neolycopersici]
MLSLYLTAELNGVTDLRPKDNSEFPFWYTFKVQCTSCRETHPNAISINRFEVVEKPILSGNANFARLRESSATSLIPPIAYHQESPAKRQKIIEFDSRGLELLEFLPEGEWLANGTQSGNLFTKIDLTEGEWFDYDESSGEEVSIVDLKWEISKN